MEATSILTRGGYQCGKSKEAGEESDNELHFVIRCQCRDERAAAPLVIYQGIGRTGLASLRTRTPDFGATNSDNYFDVSRFVRPDRSGLNHGTTLLTHSWLAVRSCCRER